MAWTDRGRQALFEVFRSTLASNPVAPLTTRRCSLWARLIWLAPGSNQSAATSVLTRLHHNQRKIVRHEYIVIVSRRAEFGPGQKSNANRRPRVRALSCGVPRRARSGPRSGLRPCRLPRRPVSNNIIGIELCRIDLRWKPAFHRDSPFEFAVKPWMNVGTL